ncbi:MAG TPA: DALR anticodon-binding domain-containing protein [Paenisporosarcina sp.]|nr:DALR anticodon-binding domain-containing protein [Paenisporosarcina sp.]
MIQTGAKLKSNRLALSDPSNEDMTRARLALITAVRTTIANALRLIGVSAPEKM